MDFGQSIKRLHYLYVLVVVVCAMRWCQYLWPTSPSVKGQAIAIVVMYIGFIMVLMAWLVNSRHSQVPAVLSWFIGLSIVLWLAVMAVGVIHQDLFNYTALLLPVLLLMIWWKPPTVNQAWVAIRTLGWSIVVMLFVTRVLEMLGLLAVRDVPNWIDQFDRDRYWLPLRDLMGLDGRWPGPFGHNGHTAMAGALLIVIAVAQWKRLSSPVFLVVGVLTLLLINGRASIGASFVGIAVVVIFSRRGWLARVPTWMRIAVAVVGVGLVAFLLYRGEAGMTGRNNIWPAFYDLWQTSPVVGVGTTGINASSGITHDFGHAHNLYLDALTRHGLIGFTLLMTVLGLGVVIASRAAIAGSAGALAIIAAYLVMDLTEPRNDWIHPSVTGLLFVLCVLAAAGVSRSPDQVSRAKPDCAVPSASAASS